MTRISIVIPTRERLRFLRHSLRTALAIDDPDVEIVVSDNASTDGTAEHVNAIDDPRLRYVNTGARVSMRQNFEFAFHASTGDYLIFFGDDDGILPGQFVFLKRLIASHRPDGLSWRKATYGWPIEGFGRKTGGVRFYRDDCFGLPARYRGADNRDNLLSARVSAMRPVPDIYHGCLSRDWMLRTAFDGKTVFDGAIPDVSLTYRAILKDGDFVHVDHPLSINGYGPASTGGGHNAEEKGGSGTGASRQFARENRTDTMKDVLEHAGSVPLAFFSTLETLRRNHGLADARPDYLRWYRYVLSSARRNPALREEIARILGDHAAATGTGDALSAALAARLLPKRSATERLERFGRQLASFRVSAAEGEENTILTAARTMDAILGADLGAVLSGDLSRRAAWRRALARARGFRRQL